MSTTRGAWSAAGVVAGFAGVATSYFVAMALTIRDAPLVAVGELVIRLTPGAVAEKAISVFGRHDKDVLLLVIGLLVAALFAWAGRLAERSRWAPTAVFVVLAVVGGVGVWSQRGAGVVDLLAVVVGFLTWMVTLPLLTAPLRRHEQALAAETVPVSAGSGTSELLDSRSDTDEASAEPRQSDHTRRTFLLRAAVVAVAAAALGAVGRGVGRGRRHVEEARRLLRLPGVTIPTTVEGAHVDLEGMPSWMTPAQDLYRVDTSIIVPAIEPADWRLRIHGMVDREVVLTYQDLIARRITEGWITLNCVSNPVGGDLIGNGWWSGVRIAGLLSEAGVHDGADAVLQTSDDGWTCGTPLSTLTDDRSAMLAVALNGRPLPIDHGFPVRTIVPGLYGYVSACKWVVEMKVTRFSEIEAYWTERGWAERGPVKLASRIDVPRSGGEVAAGGARVGGAAWAQHIGIEAVEVAVDGGSWQPATLGRVPDADTWVQWSATIDVEAGDHKLKVRATDRTGLVQTGVERDVLPDGATGWHTVDFTAT